MRKISYPYSVIFSILILLSVPVLGYLVAAWRQNIPAMNFMDILVLYNPFQLVFNLFLVTVAIGMVFIQRWAFLSYLILGFLFSAYCLVLIFLNLLGVAFWRFGGIDYLLLLIIIASSVFILINMIRKEISSPYFSLVGRGWRMATRDTIPLPVQIRSSLGVDIQTKTENISSSGCLISLDEKTETAFMVDEKLEIDITLPVYNSDSKNPERLSFHGEVVRIREGNRDSSPGVGIKFLSERTLNSEKLLEMFLSTTYAPRYSWTEDMEILDSENSLDNTSGDKEKADNTSTNPEKTNNAFDDPEISKKEFDENRRRAGVIYNISTTGLYVESTGNFQPDQELRLDFQFMGIRIQLTGSVVWINPNGDYGKEKGFGFRIHSVRNSLWFRVLILYLFVRDETRR